MMHPDFFGLLCLSGYLILKGAAEILTLEPSRLVVEYGAKASANCSTSVSHKGMGWEASEGAVDMVDNVQLVTWTVPKLTQWDIKAICFINTNKQIAKELPVTVYKLPDTMSIHTDCTIPVIEGNTCLLRCDVQNVAPVQYLKVTWYKQQLLMKQNETSTFNGNYIKPVNKSVDFIVQLSRHDDGAKYWCEATLELGAEGPQPPPTNKSEPLSIRVDYKPDFSNDTETIEVHDGKINLTCIASANPPPSYTWKKENMEVISSSSSLSVSEAGIYTCIAENQHGQATKHFIIKYHDCIIFWVTLGVGLCLAALLLIAGFMIMYRKRLCRRLSRNNKTPYAVNKKEEGEELVIT